MRVAVVGAGRIGAFHAMTLAAAEGVDRVLIVDSSADVAAALVTRLEAAGSASASAHGDVSAVIASGVDAVVIGAPTPVHAPVTIEAAMAGIPVFCEKPIAIDLEEAQRVVEAVEASGTLVQVGFQRRFDPSIRAVAEARERGEIGELYLARLGTHDADPPPPGYIEGPAGIFTDTLVHDFDVLRFVTGQDAVRMMAMGTEAAPADTGLDVPIGHAAVLVQLSGGAQAVLTASRHDPRGYDVRVELLGSRDSVAVGYGHQPQLRLLDAGEQEFTRHDDFIKRFETAYRAEIDAFLDCIRTGAPSPCTVRDGYAAFAMSLAAWESKSTGLPVDVPSLAVPA